MSNDPTRYRDALELVQHNLKLARKASTISSDYISMFKSYERPTVCVGAHYATIDNSVVYVDEKLPPCPGCGNPYCMMQTTSEQRKAIRAHQQEEGGCPVGKSEAPDLFRVTVLTGGHGFSALDGAIPGEPYYVNSEGLAMVRNPDPEHDCTIVEAQFGMVGLSLKHRVNIKTCAYEPPAGCKRGQ